MKDDTRPTALADAAAKVPEVTALFWLIKILATTLGETAGDTVSMSMGLGYLAGTGVFAAIFAVTVAAQIRAARFNPWLYWATIVATTTVGTTLADFADRSLGIGYAGGTALLVCGLGLTLWAWVARLGTVSIASVRTPEAELFYWLTILFSQTLGTALGDWMADSAGFGYLGSAVVFGTLLAACAAARFWTRISRTALFWIAFVLTRPLGAVLGDFLDKPLDHGGLALSRGLASAVLLAAMLLLILARPQRPAVQAH